MRGPFEGMLNIVRFNWPWYLNALIVVATSLLVALLVPLPEWVFWLLVLAAAGAAYFFVVSLWAAHLIYDRSPLYRWDWLKTTFPTAPRRLVNIHEGFDETSEALRQLYPQTPLTIFDLYHPLISTEPSIARARRYRPAKLPAISVDAAHLPAETASCDALLLFLAAHEIRTAEGRTRFVAELQRMLAPGGRLLLVEHLRNLPNTLAFGPGCLHFYPRCEWLRLVQESGLQLTQEQAITPFVRLFVLQKSGGGAGEEASWGCPAESPFHGSIRH